MRRNGIRAKKKNRARARVQSTSASHESTGEPLEDDGECEREREREEREARVFSSPRVEAPGRFSAARVSRRVLVQSLQNGGRVRVSPTIHQAPPFHRTSSLPRGECTPRCFYPLVLAPDRTILLLLSIAERGQIATFLHVRNTSNRSNVRRICTLAVYLVNEATFLTYARL